MSINSKFGDLLIEDIISKLNGTHNNFSRFESPDKPSKNIILGTLSDKSRLEFSENSNEAKEEKRTASSVKNNSLSVKFLIKDENITFNIKPCVSIFYRVIPSFKEQVAYTKKRNDLNNEKVKLKPVWKRKDLQFNHVSIPIKKYALESLDLKSNIDSVKTDPDTLGYLRNVSSKILENEDLYYEEIEKNAKVGIPDFNWKCDIFVSFDDFVQDEQKLKLVEVGLVNVTEPDQKYETFLFNSKIEIDLGDTKLIPFNYKYEFEDNPISKKTLFRCLNCQAKLNGNKIITEHFAKHEQKKLKPRTSLDGMRLTFKDLSCDIGINLLENLHLKMGEFLEINKKSPNISDPLYKKSVQNFENTKKRFYEGIKTLKNNKKAFYAFKLMNESFFRNSKKYNTWRLFQIVFIVSIIPDIIDKSSPERKTCEVLHIMTGGGKSEAYFGLVIFSAFWDRLSGKKFGTTAITKFPLRMLSIQQLQRIANLFIWAENVRLKQEIEGEPFSVSYFVGNSEDFPSNPCKIIKRLEKATAKHEEIPGKIIDKCPLCNGNVILDYKKDQNYVIHKCKSCDNEFQLFYTDQETYRFLPTFIVATDDKFAGIGLNRRFKNLFGGKLSKCPKHGGFIPQNDVCDVITDSKCINKKKYRCNTMGEPVSKNFDTGPTLIIQDEMHLIKEGFGTIDSHFESLIETLQEELCGYKFKNIAMTATITGAKEQIKHLYHKKSRIFPGNLSENYENDFFFEYEFDEKNQVKIQRQLIGLKPNLRDNHFASLLTIKYFSEFIEAVEENIKEVSLELEIPENEMINIIKNYKSVLTYHNRKNDAKAMSQFLDTVVNNALDDYLITPKVLTGDNTLDEIKELIKVVNNYYDDPNTDKKTLLSVFATSIVSHGVDIDKWNLMVIQGMPRNTAEYIQALSRVGRKYHGVVFLWFYPNRSRDLSFYQNFNIYHQILHHKVENVPLSRWAKLGFKQTITSVFNASILNYMSDVLEMPIYSVSDVNKIFKSKENRERIIKFIEKAYVINSSMVGVGYFKKEIFSEVEARLNYLANYTGTKGYFFPEALKDNHNKYYNTPSGMRGIQDQVTLIPSDDEIKFFKKI